jgi:hypothetical protein
MTYEEQKLVTISMMAAAMTGRYMASGMLSDISIGVEAEHVAKRAIAIYNEVGDQLWPGEKVTEELMAKSVLDALRHEADTGPGKKADLLLAAIHEIERLSKRSPESAPTGGETTPPFQGPKVGAGWSDEKLEATACTLSDIEGPLEEESGYHK